MAEDSDENGGAPPSNGAADEPLAKADSSSNLPDIESPPLSPAGETARAAPESAIEPTDLVVFAPETRAARVRFRLKPRHKRNMLVAATLAMAAAFGVVVGMAAGGGFAARKPTVNLVERQSMQRSIAKLDKEIALLKASVAVANKSARGEVAKVTERLSSAPEITGSIPEVPAAVPTPLPAPRPAVAAETRPPVVRDWSIRYVRDGYVYVRGHGDTYQVQLGAPLPGLGPVQAVKRQHDRWLVVTPKGLIVSLRDRRYFERF
jgi:hypothetical protein